MFLNLTYPLGNDTPPYGENAPVVLRRVSSIDDGDVANTMELRMPNHSGTHIDAPFHFAAAGRRLTELEPADLVFDAPVLVEIPKSDGELVTAADLEAFEPALEGADLLLVRTGWAEAHRRDDPARYGRRAPGFAASAAHHLLERTAVRGLAMDMPSAASPVAGPANDEGIEFHRVVLRSRDQENAGGRSILLVEDVFVDALEGEAPQRVILAPLWLEDADGAPCTVLAERRIRGSKPR